MAQTVIDHNSDLALREWDKRVFVGARKATFFDQLRSIDTTGLKAQKLVQDYAKKGIDLMTDTNGFMESRSVKSGTDFTFELQIHNEDDAWVKGDNLLEGNEKNMDFATQRVVWEVYKMGVNRGGSRTKYESNVDLVKAMHTQVKIDVAEKLDSLRFAALKGVASQNVLATTKTTIKGRIGELVDAATTGVGIDKIIKPVYIGGEEYYVIGMSTADARAWIESADYQSAMRDANLRGPKNPIFTGSLGVIENCILMRHSDFDNDKSILMGAQALLELWGPKKLQQFVGTSKYGKEEQMSLAVFLYYGVEGAMFSDGKVHAAIQADITP